MQPGNMSVSMLFHDFNISILSDVEVACSEGPANDMLDIVMSQIMRLVLVYLKILSNFQQQRIIEKPDGSFFMLLLILIEIVIEFSVR